IRGKASGKTHERRPQAPMHERHLAVEHATRENLARFDDGVHHPEDEMTARMRPPAALDRLPDDRFGKARRRTFRREQNYTVIANEADCLVGACEPDPMGLRATADARARGRAARVALVVIQGVPGSFAAV